VVGGVEGVEGKAGVFDSFLVLWESFSPGGIDAEMERRRVAAAVTGGKEFDRLVKRVRCAGVLFPRISSLSVVGPEGCQVLRGVGGMTLLDLSELRESFF